MFAHNAKAGNEHAANQQGVETQPPHGRVLATDSGAYIRSMNAAIKLFTRPYSEILPIACGKIFDM
jgi:hypothetical protein